MPDTRKKKSKPKTRASLEKKIDRINKYLEAVYGEGSRVVSSGGEVYPIDKEGLKRALSEKELADSDRDVRKRHLKTESKVAAFDMDQEAQRQQEWSRLMQEEELARGRHDVANRISAAEMGRREPDDLAMAQYQMAAARGLPPPGVTPTFDMSNEPLQVSATQGSADFSNEPLQVQGRPSADFSNEPLNVVGMEPSEAARAAYQNMMLKKHMNRYADAVETTPMQAQAATPLPQFDEPGMQTGPTVRPGMGPAVTPDMQFEPEVVSRSQPQGMQFEPEVVNRSQESLAQEQGYPAPLDMKHMLKDFDMQKIVDDSAKKALQKVMLEKYVREFSDAVHTDILNK